MLFQRRSSQTEVSVPKTTDYLLWGDTPLPLDEATSHFLAVGATGSGKTTIIRLFLQTVFPRFLANGDNRAIVYDAKQDALPLVHAMAPHIDIATLNPFDQRGAAWDIAADVIEPRVAIEIAFTLFPDLHESQPFFTNAVRHLSYGLMASFMLSEQPWSFADLIRALKSRAALKRILKRHTYTRALLPLYFSEPRLAAHIMSSVATKSLPFEPIAAAWEHAERRVSLRQWAESAQILILPNSEISRAPIDAINRCIFKLATDITLNQSESFTRRSWFVIDELPAAGKLDGLVSLLKKGRSKGACVVLAFQSVSGLRDQHLYGNHLTDELLGQIGNRFFGRLECPVTAEWASQVIGDQDALSRTYNRTNSSQGTSEGITKQWQRRRAVLPSEFMNISPCTLHNGLSGYYLVRSIGAFHSHLSGTDLFTSQLIPPADMPEFLPRPGKTQFLQPWTPEQAAKFRLLRRSPDKDQGKQQKRRNRPEITPDDINDLFS